MSIILFFGFIILVSILLAKVEINVEGRYGGAEKLPVTWRATNKYAKRFFAMTSYHVYMGLFMITFAHLIFAVGIDWAMNLEMLILSAVAFVTVGEDFMWFILNPAVNDKTGKRLYGIRNFREKCVEWFKGRWFLFCPDWYFWYLPIAIILYIGSYYI